MHRSKKKRNIIIFSLVGVLLCMVAGYAAFQTQLKVTGTSKVTSNWDIEITNVTSGTPTGSAENAVAPSFEKLWASMEANLYDKGDAMEYDVTIENKGTLDAKLNDIITNLDNSNNDAVIISFSGYTKGEVLKAKNTKVVHVKIEYNPKYEGGETSSEVEINFDYGQNNNEENNPDNQYLLTYDYSTNGGQSVELDKEYMLSGSNVNLDNTATKEGWTFVGWNTDKDAQIGLKEYQMPKENTTLYAIYSKDLKVTYEKEDTVESIGKNEDACTIYNNETSCEVTLPEINVNDESATIGWYENNNKVGNPRDKYTLKNDITLIAKAEFEPIIRRWLSGASTDFHNSTYKNNIITATFLDNKDVPDNAVASWDVSANKNGSVMAWVVADESDSSKYHLYIGGNGGVIANKSSSYLFYNFKVLTEINFGDNFDTSNVTNMDKMFYNCQNLTTVDVGSFDTSNVTNMSYMFYGCSNLTSLDVSQWDTGNVDSMYRMFYNCSKLTTLDVSNFDTSNVTNMDQMFYGCSNLTSLDVSQWDTSNVTDMSSMFFNCSNLTTLDVSDWNTSNVTGMSSMFYNCSSLTSLDVSKWNTSKVTYMSNMFHGCSNLTTLDVSKWNTSKVTHMSNMFSFCRNLTTLDVSKWITSNVTSMYGLFYGCSSLTSLDVSDWNTSNVTDMGSMFYNCSKLTTLDVSNFDTSKVTDMGSMFYNCSNLTTLDVSKWITSNVTSMYGLFYGCSNLTTLDVSNFDTSNVIEMSSMFYNCSNLTTLVLCSFDTNKVTNMYSMFYGTRKLKSIYVGPNWTTENATTTSMFTNSGVSSVTQSNNCEIDSEDMSLSISTTSTTNSIRIVANASADSGIAKYEYSKDGGYSWTSSSYNTYTFNGLTKNTSYNIRVRATSTNGKQMEQSATVLTKNITTPTFKESETSNGKTVTITYPSGCGSTLTCSYQKDNGSVVNVTSATVNVSFTESGSLVARVSDGTNTVSSSYTVIVGPSTNIGKQPVEVVESGDGLYEDTYEPGRYVYRGQDPDNYIMFNDELWRIIAKETDGTYKIIRNNVLASRAFDNQNRTASSTYCTHASGCGVYAAVEGIFSSPSGSQSGTVTEDSSIKIYLNDDYYANNINSTAKEQMRSHSFNIGAVEILDDAASDSIEKNIAGEKMYQWTGNVGLANVSDILRASTNPLCTSVTTSASGPYKCNINYLLDGGSASSLNYWTINAYSSGSGGSSNRVWGGSVYSGSAETVNSASAYIDGTRAPRPVVFLKSDTTLNGSGTLEDPFTLS